MLKVGDIVFQKRIGGILNNLPETSRLGLVIKEHKEKGAIPQFCVRFGEEEPKWHYQHELHKITLGEKS